ncbi:MAG: large repetitive protein, partial [Solirubrobacteraceae bacterium]|nr:large repetitive protein [Solirubrobacteraceae bacterium]
MLRSSVAVLACLLALAAPAAANTFPVTSNADTVGTCTTSCTLRQAINSANADPAVDYIELEPNLGTLTLTDALPSLGTAMVINGDNAGSDAPHLRIDGSGLVNRGAGLNVTAPNVVVRGLSITGFDSYGVRIVADWATLDHLLIGKTPAGDDAAGVMGAGIFVLGNDTTIGNLDTTGGATATGNVIANTVADPTTDPNGPPHRGDGIWVYSGSNNTIEGNVISGNAGAGVRLHAAATVDANKIGTNFAGTAADGNNDWGVQVEPGATGASVLGNVVSGNEVGGVLVQADDASVTGNVVGLTADASAVLANDGNGIEVSSDNVDVGNTTAPANTIGGNTAAGVLITSTGTAYV